MLNAQSPNHGDTLASLIRQLYLHAFFDPYPRRLHPQMEGGLIYVDDIRERLVHEDSNDPLGELLLGMH